MCGIVGYVGGRPCRDLLLAGLEKLEYRGYDSAGLSLLADGEIESVRAVGNLAHLREAVEADGEPGGVATLAPEATTGIAHTRWATHGRVTEQNAHPHDDTAGDVHIVLNGIVENYVELRDRLVAAGADYTSDTDAEVVAHLIAHHHDGEIVVLRSGGVDFIDPDGNSIEREVEDVDWDEEAAEKGGYETFMLKEIHEQPDAVADTVSDRAPGDEVILDDAGFDDEFLRNLRRIVIVACGTSYHAGLVGRYAIEHWARVPVEMDVASEYRYRDPVVDENDLVIGITQSGETADTLAAMRLARKNGARVLAITNVMGSQATRDSDGVLYTRAGLEIGVAATKTYVSQVISMYLLGLKLAQVRGTLEPELRSRLISELKALPNQMSRMIETVEEPVRKIAEHWQSSEFFLYLGRHVGLPVALEGALKLKEISYIPTDAYAAGEMKHGPIALLDERTPVVCVATRMPILDKVLSNVAEVRARGAHVIAVATEGDTEVEQNAEEVIYVPATDWLLQPVLAIVPLQLLAYYIARARGLNVDQPRNLAKTVTVE
ncbi:MAG: glutamine--fructose-6-phosphate transaminase (isomerizing) [Thermoleophilaceae bacterium]|nr:glutamine--fructose-6-phosphate transaminase (isomerizing) [Thermoleophilaceae bacterium]